MLTDEQILSEISKSGIFDRRMCTSCGNEYTDLDSAMCVLCKEKTRQRNVKARDRRRSQGLCHKCNNPAVDGQTHCEYHRNKAVQRWRDIRQQVLDYYGNECSCCGETTPEFLSIDHINGGGNGHRKSLEANGMKKHHGTGFYKWLIDNEYPEGYQLLCHNCNFAKGHYGVCPHKREEQS